MKNLIVKFLFIVTLFSPYVTSAPRLRLNTLIVYPIFAFVFFRNPGHFQNLFNNHKVFRVFTLYAIYCLLLSICYYFTGYEIDLGRLESVVVCIPYLYIFSLYPYASFSQKTLRKLLITFFCFIFISTLIQYFCELLPNANEMIVKLYAGPIDQTVNLTWMERCLRTNRLTGPFVSAPALGQISAFFICFILVFKRNIVTPIFVCIFLVSIWMGLQSGSLSFLLLLFLIVVLSIIRNRKFHYSTQLFKPITILFFVLLLPFAVYFLVFEKSDTLDTQKREDIFYSERIYSAFEEGSFESLSGGRFSIDGEDSIYKQNFSVLRNSFFAGQGMAINDYAFYADSLFWFYLLSGGIPMTCFILGVCFMSFRGFGAEKTDLIFWGKAVFLLTLLTGVQSAILYKNSLGELLWIVVGSSLLKWKEFTNATTK